LDPKSRAQWDLISACCCWEIWEKFCS
jgi:hypothetical protein